AGQGRGDDSSPVSLRSGAFALCFAASFIPGGVAAQLRNDRAEAVLGPELQVLSFGGLPYLKRPRQLAVPAGWAVAFRRFRLDLSSGFVSTEISRADSSQ